jgi:hypothetical protein
MISSLITRYENWLSGSRLRVLFIISTAIYLVMVLITLPELYMKAGGLDMFDLRPMGYGLVEANKILDGLGEEGRWYYLTRQIPLDILYPGLLSAVLSGAWLMLLKAGKLSTSFPKWFIMVAVLAGLADYGENIAVVTMLLSFPNISLGLVTTASWLTIFKSGFTTIFFTALTILAVTFFYQKKYNCSPPKKVQ